MPENGLRVSDCGVRRSLVKRLERLGHVVTLQPAAGCGVRLKQLSDNATAAFLWQLVQMGGRGVKKRGRPSPSPALGVNLPRTSQILNLCPVAVHALRQRRPHIYLVLGGLMRLRD